VFIGYQYCGCSPFTFMRSKSMPVCELKRLREWSDKRVLTLDQFDHLFESHGVCRCLPSCNSITYKSTWIATNHQKGYRNKTSLDEVTINFVYEDSEYFPTIRYKQFTTKDFLAYVGGLLGLFAGISVLGLIELFYFFVLRIFVNAFEALKSKVIELKVSEATK
jgi:hypothetical protein